MTLGIFDNENRLRPFQSVKEVEDALLNPQEEKRAVRWVLTRTWQREDLVPYCTDGIINALLGKILQGDEVSTAVLMIFDKVLDIGCDDKNISKLATNLLEIYPNTLSQIDICLVKIIDSYKNALSDEHKTKLIFLSENKQIRKTLLPYIQQILPKNPLL